MNEFFKAINASQDKSIKNLEIINKILDIMFGNKCEFCSSLETTKYPVEGNEYVYLCEDCKNIGSGESSDF